MAGYAPVSTDDALAMLHASLDHLAATDWRELGGYTHGKALQSLGTAQAKWAASHALDNLDLYCFAHHHVFIHRYGWRIVKHPDGTRDAISPRGKIVRSHAPPGGTVA